MKGNATTTIVAILILISVSASAAFEPVTLEAGRTGQLASHLNRDDVLWEQPADFAFGIYCGYNVDSTQYRSWLVEDFELAGDAVITAVAWNANMIGDQPSSFKIAFYDAPADCGGPDENLIDEQQVTGYTCESMPSGYAYTAEISSVLLQAGTYWISITPVLAGDDNYLWYTSDSQWNCSTMIRYPGEGFPVFTSLEDIIGIHFAMSLTLYGSSLTAAPPGGGAPRATTLGQNSPNPFNPVTTIEYVLERPGQIRLTVHDIAGRHVATLDEGWQSAGAHQAQWSGRDFSGRPMSSGLYFVRLQTEDLTVNRKIILAK